MNKIDKDKVYFGYQTLPFGKDEYMLTAFCKNCDRPISGNFYKDREYKVEREEQLLEDMELSLTHNYCGACGISLTEEKDEKDEAKEI